MANGKDDPFGWQVTSELRSLSICQKNLNLIVKCQHRVDKKPKIVSFRPQGARKSSRSQIDRIPWITLNFEKNLVGTVLYIALRLSSDFLCDTRYTIHARSNHVYRLHFCSGDRYMRHAMYLSCSYFFYSISASDTSFWIDDTLFLKIAAGIVHFTQIMDTSRFFDYKSDFCEIFPIDKMFPHTKQIGIRKKISLSCATRARDASKWENMQIWVKFVNCDYRSWRLRMWISILYHARDACTRRDKNLKTRRIQ